MSKETIEVFLDDLTLVPRLTHVGTLHPHTRRKELAPAFEFAPDWLQHYQHLLIDPQFQDYEGMQYQQDGRLFGVFMDSAPDRWGRVLMERRENWRAFKSQRKPHTLFDLNYLLGVQDVVRTGALRFKRNADEHFLDNEDDFSVPPITQLGMLSDIVKKIEIDGVESLPEYEQWLSMLVAPGSSLGGARPKASFQHEGELWLAKFPSKQDSYDVGAWEYLANLLAQQAGIHVPQASCQQLNEPFHTFCVKRFDRQGKSRVMYASAMTLLEKKDGDRGSYLDLVEVLALYGGQHLSEDLAQLFKRAVFNLLIGNRDDHLRNHGFILKKDGWRLSPAFDINPSLSKSTHALTWNGDNDLPDLDVLWQTRKQYRLTNAQASDILSEVVQTVKEWKKVATRLKLSQMHIAQMATVIQI
jgi:serine/threonine-protein kinase HipA